MVTERVLRVVVVDDHFLVREGVRRLLEDSGQVEVVATLGSTHELYRWVDQAAPDAVITDIRMPPGNHMEGIEAAHRIREGHPDTGVVVLSAYVEESYALELFKNGTAGLAYLLKDRVGELDELVRALQEVCAGGSVIDGRVVDALVQRRTRQNSRLQGLTAREHDVLRLMAQGRSNAGIAAALFMSESAAEKHVSSILAKLGSPGAEGVDRRVTAVLTFLREQ